MRQAEEEEVTVPLRIDRHLPCCLSTAEDTFLQTSVDAGDLPGDEHGTKQCISIPPEDRCDDAE